MRMATAGAWRVKGTEGGKGEGGMIPHQQLLDPPVINIKEQFQQFSLSQWSDRVER